MNLHFFPKQSILLGSRTEFRRLILTHSYHDFIFFTVVKLYSTAAYERISIYFCVYTVSWCVCSSMNLFLGSSSFESQKMDRPSISITSPMSPGMLRDAPQYLSGQLTVSSQHFMVFSIIKRINILLFKETHHSCTL